MSNDMILESGANTIMNVMPMRASGLNASQFSKTFKGTAVARLKPAERGALNRFFNLFFRERVNFMFSTSQGVMQQQAVKE